MLVFLLFLSFLKLFWIRKEKLHLVRSPNRFVPICGTWSLYLKWLGASLVCTMARPSTRLKSSLKWLAITWPSSLFHTSLWSMVDLVLVLPILQGSFLSSEMCAGCLGYSAYCYLEKTSKLVKFLLFCLFDCWTKYWAFWVVNLDNGTSMSSLKSWYYC